MSKTALLISLLVAIAGNAPRAEFEFGVSDGKYIYRQKPQLASDVITQLGATCIYLETKWSSYEPERGRFQFDDLTQRIKACKALGLLPGLRVKTGENPWATGPLTRQIPKMVGTIPSLMPKDIADYEEYLRRLAGNCKPLGVRYYAIQNEVDSPNQWLATPEDYHRLLEAAYRTIKSVDPDALVVDHGLTSVGLGYAYVGWLVDHGRNDEAFRFCKGYLQDYYGKGIETPEDMTKRRQQSPWAKGAYELIVKKDYFALNKGCFDCFQVHLYEHWREEPEALRWVRDRMKEAGYVKPIAAWELGIHMNKAKWSSGQQAEEMVKKFVSAMAAGVTQLMWLVAAEPAKDWMTKEPLFAKRTFAMDPLAIFDQKTWSLTQAGQAYGTMTHMLKGATQVVAVTTCPGVTCFRFDGANGPVWFLWSRGGEKPIQLREFGEACSAFDIYGNPLQSESGLIKIGDKPVCIAPNQSNRR